MAIGSMRNQSRAHGGGWQSTGGGWGCHPETKTEERFGRDDDGGCTVAASVQPPRARLVGLQGPCARNEPAEEQGPSNELRLAQGGLDARGSWASDATVVLFGHPTPCESFAVLAD